MKTNLIGGGSAREISVAILGKLPRPVCLEDIPAFAEHLAPGLIRIIQQGSVVVQPSEQADPVSCAELDHVHPDIEPLILDEADIFVLEELVLRRDGDDLHANHVEVLIAQRLFHGRPRPRRTCQWPAERDDGSGITDISATIYCERDTHKGIVIGKGGSMLKKVGAYAREDMERFFGCKINLQLWVKVKEDWRNRESVLRTLGYDKNDFE